MSEFTGPPNDEINRLSEKVTKMVRNLRNNFDVQDIKSIVDQIEQALDMLGKHEYYLFSTQSKPHENEIAILPDVYLKLLYSEISKPVGDFLNASERLTNRGRRIVRNGGDEREVVAFGSTIFNESYSIARGIRRVQTAKAVPFGASSQLLPFQQYQFRSYIDSLNKRPQPKGLIETLRSYVPKWMRHPIPLAVEYGLEQDESILNQWHGYEAMTLMGEDAAEQGSPLHKVLALGEEIELTGNMDLAYRIKTWGIKSVLEMERERSVDIEQPELPLFTMGMSSIITGEVQPSMKGAYFDFQRSLTQTIQQTLERINQEIPNNIGSATQFLEELGQYYPDFFGKLMAKAITNPRIAGNTNLVHTIRSLGYMNYPWMLDLIEEMPRLTERKIFAVQEPGEVAEMLPQENIPLTTQTIGLDKDIRVVQGEEDLYSFSVSLPRIGIYIPKSNVSIELDNLSPLVEATVTVQKGDFIRHVPITLDLHVEESNMVRIEAIPTDVQDPAVLQVYKYIVTEAIRYEAERVRARLQREAEMQAQLRAHAVKTSEQRPQLTRDQKQQRKQQIRDEYEAQKQKHKEKTRGMIVPSPSDEALEVEVDSAPEELQQENLHIIGISEQVISELLKEGGLNNILTPSDVTTLLNREIAKAEVARRMFGSKMVAKSYGDITRKFVNLRQVSLTRQDSTAVRIYLEDIGGGNFYLRGIMRKRDRQRQTLYIRDIIKKITQEEAEGRHPKQLRRQENT